MSLHTPADLAELVQAAGWSGTDRVTAVAVILASSAGWDSRDGGLFLLGGTSGDAAGQCKAAHDAFVASGWSAFKVYRVNLHLLFMPVAAAGVAAADASNTARKAVDNAADTVGDVTDAAQKLSGDLLGQLKNAVAVLYKAGAWLGDQDNWARIAEVAIGGAMIVVGLGLLVGKTVLGAESLVAKPLTGGGESE